MSNPRPTVRARELGLALRRAAEPAGMTNRKLAKRLGWSDSRISRIYTGTRGISVPDLVAVLAVCGIKGPAKQNLIQLTAHAHEPGWWQDYDDRLPAELTTLIDYENSAIGITSLETAIVPGLLQIPEYALALMRGSATIPKEEFGKRVAARMRRTKIFTQANPPQFRFFLDEYVLSRTGPGRDIMSKQLHHLLRMSVRPYVEIRVIPDAAGFHTTYHAFRLMEFTELHPVVHIESETSVLFLERRQTTTAYRRMADGLAHVALTEGQSRDWIANLARELGEPREEHDERAGGSDMAEELAQPPE
jgi:transcriptional regulator with XRE-family HTH domain